MEKNIKFDLEEVLNELKHYKERKANLNQKHAALIVIDMQNFFERIARRIIKNVTGIIRICREREVPIIFTQHGHTDPEIDSGILGEWWGELIISGTKDWEFLPEMDVRPNDILIPKKRYSAFFETDLDRILKGRGVKDLIISGVMTNLCCETTARDAFMRDYRVFFLIDATATGSYEHHMASLKNLGFGFAYLKTCKELIEELELI